MKNKIFHFFETVALIVAMFGILWAPGHLIFHDIPTALRGYEEIAVEWEYEDDTLGSGRHAASTMKRRVSGGEVFGMIVEDLMIGLLSFGVWAPFLKDVWDIEPNEGG
jgi:hypothetical protein